MHIHNSYPSVCALLLCILLLGCANISEEEIQDEDLIQEVILEEEVSSEGIQDEDLTQEVIPVEKVNEPEIHDADFIWESFPVVDMNFWAQPYKIVPIDFDADGDDEQLIGFDDVLRVMDFRTNPPSVIAISLITRNGPQVVYNQSVADINNDGFPDVAVAGGQETIRVLMNNKGEGFKDRVNYAASGETRGVTLADIDNDGLYDLLYTTQDDGRLKVRMGREEGLFGAEISYDASPKPYYVTTADLDLDGDLDVLVPNESADFISIFFNRGNGKLEDAVHLETAGQRANYIAVSELNGDEWPDIVSASWRNKLTSPADDNGKKESVSIFFGEGNGKFGAAVDLGGFPGTCWLKIADLDNDSDEDIVVTHFLSGALTVYSNDGKGNFSAEHYYTGDGAYGIQLDDFDADGFTDILVTNIYEKTFSLLHSNGDGTLVRHRKFYPWKGEGR